MTEGASSSAETFVKTAKSLHLLTLTPFYPVLEDDARGCFVAEPLPWLEPLGMANSVVGVQAFYRRRIRPNNSGVPARWYRFFALPGVFGLPTSGAFLFARVLDEIRRLHEVNPIHVIHAHAPLPCGDAAMLLSRELHIPFVVTVHGLDAYSANQDSAYAGMWCKRVSRLVYRSAQRVICVSEAVRNQVVTGAAAPVNTAVIYKGAVRQLFTLWTHPSA